MFLSNLPSHAELFQIFLDRKLLPAIARNRTRNTSVSWEDAAQVALQKLWQATQQERFHGDVENYCRWSTTVACRAIIDYVRHETRHACTSLDQLIPGTEIPLLDTLVDEFDALDAIAQADLILDVIAKIAELDRRHPQRHYQLIWQGLVQGKKQTQIAQELEVTPNEINNRWREIRRFVARAYGAGQSQNQNRNADRRRSSDSW